MGDGVATRVAQAARSRAPALPHSPGLDGLRAVAVLAVLGYHLDLPLLGGGFLGVEVFFALSGFLITQLLVGELRHHGRVDARRFALARARRLVPALVACVVATVLLHRLLRPDEAAGIRADALAGLLYVQNWHLVAADVPYGQVFDPSPLLHLWSLGVEGQLYVLWPLLFVGVLALRARRTRVVATLALAGASAVLMAVQYDPVDTTLAYYATWNRAGGFLAGAALAVVWTPARWTRPLPGPARVGLDLLGVLALTTLVAGFTAVSEFDEGLYRYGGFLLVGLATAAAVLGASRPTGLLATVLSLPALTWVGRRSYGIYLYHWPIVVFSAPLLGPSSPRWAVVLVDIVRVGVTLLVAEASHRWLEAPLRRVPREPRRPLVRASRVAASGTALAGAVAVVLSVTAVPHAVPTSLPTALPTALPTSLPTSLPGSPPAPVPWTGGLAGATGDLTAGAADGGADGGADGPVPAAPPPAAADVPPAAAPAPGAAGTPPARAPATPEPATASAGGPVLVVGDSIALGSADALRAALGPGATVDAAVGRQFTAGVAIVRAWAAAHDGPVVVALGANGTVRREDVVAMADAVAPRRLVLVGVCVPRRWQDGNNATLRGVAGERGGQVVFVDWAGILSGRPGMLGRDRVHPNRQGRDLLAASVAAGLGS